MSFPPESEQPLAPAALVSQPRVGVVLASPLLALGVIAILEQALSVQAIAITLREVTESQGLAAVLLDARSAADELCEIVTRLRKRLPLLKIVALGPPLPAEEVQKFIGAGAKGYLLESAGEAEIRMAMEVVLDGSIWAPRKVLATLIDEGTALADAEALEPPQEELSAREWEVMNLLMAGHSNREIAAALQIEAATVKAHLGRMLRKTHSRNRLEMTLRCVERKRGVGERAAEGAGA